MTSLPVDIVLNIFDFCYLSQYRTPDYATLCALSLVCKQFTRDVQALLFRSVFLWRDRLACSFGAALNPSTEKGQWLAGRVRFLRATVRPSGSREGHGLSQRTFLAVIRACPDLHEIDMDPHGEFEPYLFSIMRSRPPPVRALRFRITDAQHYLIISLFSNLKYLYVKDAGGHIVPPDTEPPLCALHEFHWRGDMSAAEWILRRSIGTLEILTLEGSFTCLPALRTILETHGHTLRSLSLQSCGSYILPLFGHCVRLEEFCYGFFPTAELLAALPSTLEHLQFTGFLPSGKPAMQDLLNFIQGAPSLLNVTYELCHWSEKHQIDESLIRLLAKTCYKHLIVFFYFSSPFGSFPGERLEFGPVSSFPRPLSLSPLRRGTIFECGGRTEHRTYA